MSTRRIRSTRMRCRFASSTASTGREAYKVTAMQFGRRVVADWRDALSRTQRACGFPARQRHGAHGEDSARPERWNEQRGFRVRSAQMSIAPRRAASRRRRRWNSEGAILSEPRNAASLGVHSALCKFCRLRENTALAAAIIPLSYPGADVRHAASERVSRTPREYARPPESGYIRVHEQNQVRPSPVPSRSPPHGTRGLPAVWSLRSSAPASRRII